MVGGFELRANHIYPEVVRAPEGPRQRRDAGIFAFQNNHSGCNRVRLRLKEGASKETCCKQEERMQ